MPRLYVLQYGALLRALKRIRLQPQAIYEETIGQSRKRCGPIAIEWQRDRCRYPLDHDWVVVPVRSRSNRP